MNTIHHALLSFLYTFTVLAAASSSAASYTNTKSDTATATSFVKSACNSTTYPGLCNKVCLPYAPKIKGDLRKMGLYSLKGVLDGYKKASRTLLKLSKDKRLKQSERLAIKDCLEENEDTLDEIRESISLIGGTKNASDTKAKIYDIKTWISAALTDEDTCMNGLEEENVRASVKAKIGSSVRYVSMLCSNSISIITLLQN